MLLGMHFTWPAQSSAFLTQQLRGKKARAGGGLQMTLGSEDVMVTIGVNS